MLISNIPVRHFFQSFSFPPPFLLLWESNLLEVKASLRLSH